MLPHAAYKRHIISFDKVINIELGYRCFRLNQHQRCLSHALHPSYMHPLSYGYLPQPAYLKLMRQVIKAIYRMLKRL